MAGNLPAAPPISVGADSSFPLFGVLEFPIRGYEWLQIFSLGEEKRISHEKTSHANGFLGDRSAFNDHSIRVCGFYCADGH
jgi:hypothetical protein